MKLITKCNNAVDKEIKKEARAEAKEILKFASEAEQQEFLDYHKKDQGNICCLVLDKLKRDLIKAGKLTKKADDNFGKPMFLE